MARETRFRAVRTAKKPLLQYTHNIYKEGLGEVSVQTGIKVSFDVTDNKAIDVMNESNIFLLVNITMAIMRCGA